MKKLSFCIAFIVSFLSSFAQTQHQNSGWLMFVNNTKFNDKWGLAFDVQFRSADELGYLRNVLIRPGLTYFVNKNNNVTLGYLLNTTKIESLGESVMNFAEHRIWEQYIHTHRLGGMFATQRFRLEQRFIEQNNGDNVFAQRIRYFFRFIQPLQKKAASFDKGAFLALQNELFFNIQNKSKLNNKFFDQNRAYLAAGYRFSKKLDAEIGYLNQAINGPNNYTINNVVQLAFYTRF